MTIHLLPNAHLDPVWLWDLREGLNEGISFVRTLLRLMEENPKLTFIRGEALIYQHLERYDPASFAKIVQYIAEGRWEVVGGVWVQPDTNLPSENTFHRHLNRGMAYFRERLGQEIKVAWAADSFGHAAGLPDIYASHGLKYFACTRPQAIDIKLPADVFWWQGVGGAKILSFRQGTGWYGCERDEMTRRLDAMAEHGAKSGLANEGCMFGLGNHGGGPTRRHIADIEQWANVHPDIEVKYSTFAGFFRSIEQELQTRGQDAIPTVVGELNFCLRGCYASSARTKFTYRKLEAGLDRAEAVVKLAGEADAEVQQKLAEAEETLLINSFHDILPGSAIERALEEQQQQMGGALHVCRMAEMDAANRISAKLCPTVKRIEGDVPSAVPFVVINPHEQAFAGFVELEQSLDARPISRYQSAPQTLPLEVLDDQGKPLPFQRIAAENHCSYGSSWRARVLVQMRLPANSSRIVTMGYVENAQQIQVQSQVGSPDAFTIVAERAKVVARPGALQAQLEVDGIPLLSEGLRVELYDEPFGSWGAWTPPGREPTWEAPVERFAITRAQVLEAGPLRACLWVRFAGKTSHIDLSFMVRHDSPVIEVSARVLMNDLAKRLMLVMPGGVKSGIFDVMGGQVRRQGMGEFPGSKWVIAEGDKSFAFVSNALYSFNLEGQALRATVVRTTGYALDVPPNPNELPWEPYFDLGEHLFRFALAKADAPVEEIARDLEQPPVVQAVPPAVSPGKR